MRLPPPMGSNGGTCYDSPSVSRCFMATRGARDATDEQGNPTMKLHRIRPIAIQGDFISKSVVQEDSKESWYKKSSRLLEKNKPLPMQWNPGEPHKTIVHDLIPSTARGLLLSDRAIEKMSTHLRGLVPYVALVNDGTMFHGVLAKNYAPNDAFATHLLFISPRHHYNLVSASFKSAWEQHALTGADFEDINEEMDDGLFLAAN